MSVQELSRAAEDGAVWTSLRGSPGVRADRRARDNRWPAGQGDEHKPDAGHEGITSTTAAESWESAALGRGHKGAHAHRRKCRSQRDIR